VPNSASKSDFLIPSTELSVADVMRLCDGQLLDENRAGEPVAGLSSVDDPRPGTLVYVQRENKRDSKRLADVAAVLCSKEIAEGLPEGPAKIIVSAPQAAFARIGRHLYPDNIGPARVTAFEGIRPEFPDARVSSLAILEEGVVIEPGAVVGDHAGIGRNTVIGANAVVANRCQIGRDCHIGASAVIQYALIGNGVLVHGGVQIGQDGFGFVPGPTGLEKVPQLGRVIIQDRVEIGANSTIDRGALGDTVIGEGTKIDNLVQIAHNVQIGRNCAIAGHVGLSGSVKLGDGCMLGGRVGIADHVTVGSGVQIAAASGVMHDIPDGEKWAGVPAMPAKDFFRQVAKLRKLSQADKKPK